MVQAHHLEGLDYSGRELLACEALLRRAAALCAPFVLKGSMLTRQYLQNPHERRVGDMDLLYLEHLEDPQRAGGVFTHWLRQITETGAVDDGVRFRSFSENAFFRRIDYAMADDFPTVNTDLAYWFSCEGREENDYDEISLDISFNLEMPVPPIPLDYVPAVGGAFAVPLTVPLSVQVAWKLHQTLVRARYKDLQDLTFLLTHPRYDREALGETLLALRQECLRDGLRWPVCAEPLFRSNLGGYYIPVSKDWDWRQMDHRNGKEAYFILAARLRTCLDEAGINAETYGTLSDQMG